MNRPLVEVWASNGVSLHRVTCLVDTGADDTVLDLGTASMLTINLGVLPQLSVATANGATRMWQHPGLSLTFVGSTVTVPVLFAAVSAPLLGRSAFRRATISPYLMQSGESAPEL